MLYAMLFPILYYHSLYSSINCSIVLRRVNFIVLNDLGSYFSIYNYSCGVLSNAFADVFVIGFNKAWFYPIYTPPLFKDLNILIVRMGKIIL